MGGGGHAKKPAPPQQTTSVLAINPAPKPKPRKSTPEVEDDTERALSTDDDYQTELPKGSMSLAAAHAGDEAVNEAQSTASPFRLPAMLFSSEHSRQKEKELREKADRYNRNHLGHGTERAPYKEMTAQAEGYQNDASNLEAANGAYNKLVPQSAFALDSVIRFKVIQGQLGSADFLDGETVSVTEADLTNHVSDRKAELARAISDTNIKETKGQVTAAAGRFRQEQENMVATLLRMQGLQMRQLIKRLQNEKAESVKKRDDIREAIESANSVSEFIGKAIGIGNGYVGYGELTNHEETDHESDGPVPAKAANEPKKDNVKPPPGYKEPKKEVAHTGPHEHVNTKVATSSEENLAGAEAGLEVAEAANEVGGVALGIAMHALHDGELADIETRIGSLDDQIMKLEDAELANDVKELRSSLEGARTGYVTALHDYENALASRRTAYAKAGSRADVAHGGRMTGGNDKASQTMLFISAARETNLVLRTALSTASDAGGTEDVLHDAIHEMGHRAHAYLEDDWRMGEAEGGNTKDRQQLMQAYGQTTKWIEATKKEADSFQPIEDAARAMLNKTGKMSGDY